MATPDSLWLLHDVAGFDQPVATDEVLDLFCDDVISVDTLVQPVEIDEEGVWQPIGEKVPVCEDDQLGLIIGELLSHRYMKLHVYPVQQDRPQERPRRLRQKPNSHFSLLFVMGFFPLFLLGALFFNDGSTPWMYPTGQETTLEAESSYQPSGVMRQAVSVTFALYLGVVAAWVLFGVLNMTGTLRRGVEDLANERR